MQKGAAISWSSKKETLSATSSNLAESLALHQVNRECLWLRRIENHICVTWGIPFDGALTPLDEDNEQRIHQK